MKWVAILAALALLAWGAWSRVRNSTGGRVAPWQTAALGLVVWTVIIGVPVCGWKILEAVTMEASR